MRSSAGRGRRKLALSDMGTPFLQWGRGGMQCVSGCRIKQHCPQRFCIVLPSVKRSFTVREVKGPCPSTVGCRGGGKMACISLPGERCLCIRPLFKGERQAAVFAYVGRGGFPDIKKGDCARPRFFTLLQTKETSLPRRQEVQHQCDRPPVWRRGKFRTHSKREEPSRESCSLEEERVYCAPSF